MIDNQCHILRAKFIRNFIHFSSSSAELSHLCADLLFASRKTQAVSLELNHFNTLISILHLGSVRWIRARKHWPILTLLQVGRGEICANQWRSEIEMWCKNGLTQRSSPRLCTAWKSDLAALRRLRSSWRRWWKCRNCAPKLSNYFINYNLLQEL